MPHCIIYDRSSLRGATQPQAQLFQVIGLDGRTLAVVIVDGHLSLQEQFSQAVRQALSSTLRLHGHTPVRLGFLDPHTGKVAVEVNGRQELFGDDQPVTVAAEGTVAEVRDGTLTLEGGRTLPRYAWR